MNQLLARVFKRIRTQQRSRAKAIRKRTDAIRQRLSAGESTWDSVEVIRAIRDGR